jgi:hypothetical protein
MMYYRTESEYYRAKRKAARRISNGRVKPADLPTNAEIRDQIEALARLKEGEMRSRTLRDMRLAALRMMRMLARFRPRVVGSVMTGHIRAGSDIDLHLFSDTTEAITDILDVEGLVYDVQRKLVRTLDEPRVFTHVRVKDRYPFELTIFPSDAVHSVPNRSITGQEAMERASIAELDQLLQREDTAADVEDARQEVEPQGDRFRIYQSLLLPLESVAPGVQYHPEGDLLYHSLQVFDLARADVPYDEELLLAALLHDVGQAIDPQDHVEAGLEALEGFITDRTAWLIEHHMLAHAAHEGTLGIRARRRLRQSENYDDLMLLGQCDRAGREPGVEVPELDDALQYLRDLAARFES